MKANRTMWKSLEYWRCQFLALNSLFLKRFLKQDMTILLSEYLKSKPLLPPHVEKSVAQHSNLAERQNTSYFERTAGSTQPNRLLSHNPAIMLFAVYSSELKLFMLTQKHTNKCLQTLYSKIQKQSNCPSIDSNKPWHTGTVEYSLTMRSRRL